MSNIKNAFKNGKAFIPFVTCGDPDLETTEQIVYAMVEAGADLIELGTFFILTIFVNNLVVKYCCIML